MLNYLSKFVLQMLPTISATVIGASVEITTAFTGKKL